MSTFQRVTDSIYERKIFIFRVLKVFLLMNKTQKNMKNNFQKTRVVFPRGKINRIKKIVYIFREKNYD